MGWNGWTPHVGHVRSQRGVEEASEVEVAGVAASEKLVCGLLGFDFTASPRWQVDGSI